MNQMIPSFVFKRRAWTAIKPWLQVLIIIGLLAVLPGLLSDAVNTLMNDATEAALGGPIADVMEVYSQPVPEDLTEEQAEAILADMESSTNAFLTAMKDYFTGDGRIILIFMGLSLVLSPVLLTPVYGSLLDVLRKRELSVGKGMRYLRLAGKVLLLELWTALRMWAWMLPGMALALASMFLPVMQQPVMWVGYGISMALGLRAGLHYVLAPIVLVDRPETSINGCIRESWKVMRTRKMEYFMLRVSFFGWYLLMSLISTFAVNGVMMAVCLTATMMGDLLLTLYINGASVAFWDAYGAGNMNPEAAAAEERHPDIPGDDLN